MAYPEMPLGYELKRVQHALRSRMDEALREVGLTTPQYAALALLRASPGMSSAELGRRAFVTAQTMNEIVGKLERSGLLVRRAHPTHGRVLEMWLTEQGEHILDAAHPGVMAVERLMLAGIGGAEQQQLLTWVRSCADALEKER